VSFGQIRLRGLFSGALLQAHCFKSAFESAQADFVACNAFQPRLQSLAFSGLNIDREMHQTPN